MTLPLPARAFSRSPKVRPVCWAKNGIAKALAASRSYQDPELFLAGMRHIQLEPVWGGTEDSAGTLRGVCALALVQCRELNSHRVLTYLTPLFADKQLSVRVNIARAVEQVGTDSAALLLRLRAELASDEPELLGACYSGVLGLEGPSAVPWVAEFSLLEMMPPLRPRWRSPRPTLRRPLKSSRARLSAPAIRGFALRFSQPLLSPGNRKQSTGCSTLLGMRRPTRKMLTRLFAAPLQAKPLSVALNGLTRHVCSFRVS